MDEKQGNESKKELMKYLDDNCEVSDLEYQNDDSKFAGKAPFIGKAKVTNGNFTEI